MKNNVEETSRSKFHSFKGVSGDLVIGRGYRKLHKEYLSNTALARLSKQDKAIYWELGKRDIVKGDILSYSFFALIIIGLCWWGISSYMSQQEKVKVANKPTEVIIDGYGTAIFPCPEVNTSEATLLYIAKTYQCSKKGVDNSITYSITLSRFNNNTEMIEWTENEDSPLKNTICTGNYSYQDKNWDGVLVSEKDCDVSPKYSVSKILMDKSASIRYVFVVETIVATQGATEAAKILEGFESLYTNFSPRHINNVHTTPQVCTIKGNISFTSGEKIYHLPGSKFYVETSIDPRYGEDWFCSEQEAINAGWRKSYE